MGYLMFIRCMLRYRLFTFRICHRHESQNKEKSREQSTEPRYLKLLRISARNAIYENYILLHTKVYQYMHASTSNSNRLVFNQTASQPLRQNAILHQLLLDPSEMRVEGSEDPSVT